MNLEDAEERILFNLVKLIWNLDCQLCLLKIFRIKKIPIVNRIETPCYFIELL